MIELGTTTFLERTLSMAHPVVFFEIGCKDNPSTQKFYASLFDWKMQAYGPAAMIDTGTKEGIMGHINSLGHEPHNYTIVYVEVDNIQIYLDKAGKIGGKTLVTPTEVPGMGHFAWLSDPEGTIVGLWKPMPK